jgi:sugar/nucleoside kinase (ribokinase family)
MAGTTPQRAQEVNRALAKNVDVMIGNEEDLTACLGCQVPNTSEDLSGLEYVTEYFTFQNVPFALPPKLH